MLAKEAGATKPKRGEPDVRAFWDYAHRVKTMTEKERIATISKGVNVQVALSLRGAFGLELSHWSQLIAGSESTIERRKREKKPLDLVTSERIDRVASMANLAVEVFESEFEAARWMATPNELLGGNTPLMQCATEIGANQVRRMLHAIEWGGVA